MYELQTGPSANIYFVCVLLCARVCLHFSMNVFKVCRVSSHRHRCIPPSFRYLPGTNASAPVGGIDVKAILFNITLSLISHFILSYIYSLIFLPSGFGYFIL